MKFIVSSYFSKLVIVLIIRQIGFNNVIKSVFDLYIFQKFIEDEFHAKKPQEASMEKERQCLRRWHRCGGNFSHSSHHFCLLFLILFSFFAEPTLPRKTILFLSLRGHSNNTWHFFGLFQNPPHFHPPCDNSLNWITDFDD